LNKFGRKRKTVARAVSAAVTVTDPGVTGAGTDDPARVMLL
jgi:hypothetical protein